MSSSSHVFQVRLRTRKFLWGGEYLLANLNSPTPIFITVQVNPMDDPIVLAQVRRGPSDMERVELGRLCGGESFTITLNNICGVEASPASGALSTVQCTIHGQ